MVDGFNLYFSLKAVSLGDIRAVPPVLPAPCRWLDLRALCDAQVHLFGKDAKLDKVYYFTALAKHLNSSNPGLVKRHTDYSEALRATGVVTEFSHFQPKSYACPSCGKSVVRYQEKQTDVAIGSKIIELATSIACETIVVVSGDSDLIPAIRTARRLNSGCKIWMAFPFGKGGNQLRNATHGAFAFSSGQYVKHQLPQSVQLAPGRFVYKPMKW